MKNRSYLSLYVIGSISVVFLALFVLFNIFTAQAQPVVVQDKSGNDFHGAGINVSYAEGKRNEGIYFNGNKSLVEVSKGESDSSGSLTVEAWVYSERPSGDTQPRRIISKDRTGVKCKYILWEKVLSTGQRKIEFMVNQVDQWYTVTYVNTLPNQQWYHVAAVYNQGTNKISLYVNGEKVSESNGPQSLKVVSDQTTVGGSADNQQNWIGRIDEVRIYESALSDAEISGSYVNNTVYSDKNLKLNYTFDRPVGQDPNLTVWALADPHIHTDKESNPPYYSMISAINDVKSSVGFDYDFGIIAGDIAGGQGCPTDPTDGSHELLDQFAATNTNPNLFYSIIGNHDAGQSGAEWFRKWVDPLGGNTLYSGISNSDPSRKNTSGYWDYYSFQEGNILFLMLGDNNFGNIPFGRDCGVGGGYPAGNYSKETFEWWKNQVEQNQDKIIITVAHHALYDTTMQTGLCDGWAEGAHGGKNWVDRRGSSMIYAIGGETIDGLTSSYVQSHPIDTIEQCYAQGIVKWRDYGFRDYLDKHPGAIDMWLHGHTHYKTNPDFVDDSGRGSIAYKDKVVFVNLGALTKAHAGADVIYSRVLEFSEGSNQATIKTFLHEDWDKGGVIHEKGFYPEAEEIVPLNKTFSR